MEPAAYLEMAQTESSHWWFVGRRAILTMVIRSLSFPKDARILEVGCGTGGNLDLLAEFGEVCAMELDPGGRQIATEKTANRYDIRAGSCPDDIPFGSQKFDLICLFDVLEHIEGDRDALAGLKERLAPGGRLIVTVPAYQWLWGPHDAFLYHKRRYTAGTLGKVVAAAGLRMPRITYFNTLLFPLVLVGRLKDKLLGSKTATGTGVPPTALNRVLTGMFSAERVWLAGADLPFGVSLLCVLEEPDGT